MFLNGITIILSGDQESFEGAAIAWATKIERNHVLVSLPIDATITEFVKLNKTFTVNVLGEHQAEIVRQYGGSKQSRPLPRNPDDLDFDAWAVPTVKDCRANLHCAVDQEMTVEEQFVVIAKIEQSRFDETIMPLVYEHAAYFD